MKKVSVINFKGRALERPTLSFHLAAFSCKEHRVLLIDVDHQSRPVNCGPWGAKLWEKMRQKAENTVNRCVFESFCNRKIEMPKAENRYQKRTPRAAGTI